MTFVKNILRMKHLPEQIHEEEREDGRPNWDNRQTLELGQA